MLPKYLVEEVTEELTKGRQFYGGDSSQGNLSSDGLVLSPAKEVLTAVLEGRGDPRS